MKIESILLNYKTPEMTIKALDHLVPAMAPFGEGGRITVVDNCSDDGSEEMIRGAVAERKLPRTEVVQTGYNGGFGFGNNFALRRALARPDPPDYLYILNSDAFPAEDAVVILADFLATHPDVGIAGSFIHGIDGEPHQTAFRFPSAVSELETHLRLGVLSKAVNRWVVALPIPDGPSPVDWLAGASMMIKRPVLEQVGLFDETFFLYFEETDLCRRAVRAGWAAWYVPESKVAHVGSASTGLKELDSPMPSFWWDSRRHYFLKNHGRPYLWAANAAHVLGAVGWRARRLIEKKERKDRPKALRDFLTHSLRHL